MADLWPNIADNISISDTEEELISGLIIDVNDSITVAENLDLQGVGIWGVDSIIVSESINPALSLRLSISDSISITDTETELVSPLVVYDNIYIRDLFTPSIPDVGVGPVFDTIAVPQIILSSAKRTAGLYISSAFKVKSAIFLRFHFDVTAETGTATLDIILQTSPDNSIWYDAVTVDQISAMDQYTAIMSEPGIWIRIKCIIAGSATPSFTFSSKMVKHMPIGRRHFVRV